MTMKIVTPCFNWPSLAPCSCYHAVGQCSVVETANAICYHVQLTLQQFLVKREGTTVIWEAL